MRNLYLPSRLFTIAAILIVLFLVSYFYGWLLPLVQIATIVLAISLVIDIILLYRFRKGLVGKREVPNKLSNGDENTISIFLESFYPFVIDCQIIDEIPFQFQKRDVNFQATLTTQESKYITYQLRPTERGEYSFGKLHVFVCTPLGLAKRRYQFSEDKIIPVYPSFIQLRKYELLAISNRLTEYGFKKLRKIGQSMEFEQIREYVVGDDYRNINWKATARKADLMVNQFQDEKSQQVYSIIDKGRTMKMPFEQLSLLDYAINSTLVLSNIILKKGDKAGLITFSHEKNTILKANRLGGQMRTIQESLYREKTLFLEANYEQLYTTIRYKVNQRSLLLLYTNFETLSALQRQLPLLRKIAKRHLLVVILFENTELKHLLDKSANGIEEVYQKAIAEKFAFEKELIIKELGKYGIQAILTPPQQLTVNTINKYLELKARGFI